MITIPRLLARRIRSVFRRALGLTPSMLEQPVRFTTGPQGVHVSASFGGFAAQYKELTPLPVCDLTIPLAVLKEAEIAKSEPLTMTPTADGGVIARWQDGAVPQQRNVAAVKKGKEVSLPKLPDSLVENPPQLCQAIALACEATDAGSARYALGCLQLRGKEGDVTATDGRQIYRQGGFRFGSERELLVRPSAVFSSKELQVERRVMFGMTPDHAVIVIGPWTFWLPIEKEARFPRIDDVIPPASQLVTTLQLSRSDRQFLADNLSRLPGAEDTNQPVTVDLNGSVAVRARAGEDGAITELRLANSERLGDELRVNTNRRFLEQAVNLGFERLSLFGPEAPIVCQDDRRTFVWAVLDASDAVKSSENSIVIESPTTAKPPPSRFPQAIPRRPLPMASRQKPASSTARSIKTTRTNDPVPKEVSVIEQTLELRSTLRDTLGKVNHLVRAIKHQKKQERLLRSTLSSLRQLQSVA